MRKIIPVIFLFSLLFGVNPNTAWGCTVFTMSQGEVVLFAGVENENARWLDKVACYFVPPNGEKKEYGYFYFYYNGNIAGGLNEKGLCFDIAGVPEHPTDMGSRSPSNYPLTLLTKCATVDEAVALLKTNYWMGFPENHLMIADASGASVILEWLKDKLYVYKKKPAYQVMTNYLITDPTCTYGPYPCPRERRATDMLKSGKPTVKLFTGILEAVKFAAFMPLYSYVYDLKAKKIYVYYSTNYDQPITFDLMKELEKGKQSFVLAELAAEGNHR